MEGAVLLIQALMGIGVLILGWFFFAGFGAAALKESNKRMKAGDESAGSLFGCLGLALIGVVVVGVARLLGCD